ncbi:MAG: CdaR family protein [Deltaproteobacteria bacterium]|jgi:YbbR domain-containing protein|nr:CdaR family protein [Deltaproteobacteria bacterium]
MEKLVKQSLNRLFGSWKWPKNWVLKLLSLFFAVFMWYFVAGEDNVDMTVRVPVEVINLPQDLIITNEYKRELEITVSGSRGLIRNLAGEVSRTVDLSLATPGPVVVKNDPKSIPVPWGVKVLRAKPSEFILQLDKLIEKRLPIHAVTSGQVPEGYSLVAVLLEPVEITITAPESIIGTESLINTLPIDISGLKGPTITHTSLDLAPEISELIGHPVVTASILIEEKQVLRVVKNIPVVVAEGNTVPLLQISPSTVTVHSAIPSSVAQKSDDYRALFTALISIADLQVGTHTVKVRVKTAEGVKILEVEPTEVSVTIPPASQ